jgi:hypothetical protein
MLNCLSLALICSPSYKSTMWQLLNEMKSVFMSIALVETFIRQVQARILDSQPLPELVWSAGVLELMLVISP